MDAALYLGPFELLEAIQAGGMAVIHRGTHRYSGEQAALKIIKPDQLADESRRHALRREIQTIATLDHPHIVRLYDIGEVSSNLSQRSMGRLPAGAPWYAMEFVDGGSLMEAPPARDWFELKRWLLELLDALAHAHAAGIIHRDLKPANILLARHPLTHLSHIKLVDFGIAQLLSSMEIEVLGEQTSEINVSGTPRYMAPEQVSGRHREQGPWTDLYAFGCVTWFLLCGVAPFSGSLLQIMRHHVFTELPPFSPLFSIPTGFEEWLRKLLSKAPHARYRRAADAARELVMLGDPPSTKPRPYEDDDPTQELDVKALRAHHALTGRAPDETASLSLNTLSFLGEETLVDGPPQPSESAHAEEDFERASIVQGGAMSVAAKIPSSWEALQPRQDTSRAGTSLGLLGLRSPRLIGRAAERDILWSALRRTAMASTPRLVVLSGEHGVGTTRLASWIARRAHEVGAAIHLSAHHDPLGDPLEGMRLMLAAHLRCAGLVGEKLHRHLMRVCADDPAMSMDAQDVEALEQLLRPRALEQQAQAPILKDVRLRHALWAKFFAHLTRERPVLLTLDEVHWSPETLLFVEFVLRELGAADLPMLMVATINPEQLAEAPSAQVIMERLVARHNTTLITLEPLSLPEQRELIDAILPLREEIAAQLAERAEGRPGFALQLIDEWSRREMLVEGLDGFSLRDIDGGEQMMPQSLQELWQERLLRLIQTLDEGEREHAVLTLEVAATLGRHVLMREWELACGRAGIRANVAMVDAMLVQKLALATEAGWSFAHRLLQEALLHRARGGGRLSAHHRHCAAMLEELYVQEHARRLIRRAHHHHQGGQHERAQALLVSAASRSERHAHITQAHEALTLREGALAALGAPHHEAWLRNQLELARYELILQEVEPARARLSVVDEHPRLGGASRLDALYAQRMHVRLLSWRARGRIKRAAAMSQEILLALQSAPDDEHLYGALLESAHAHRVLGDVQAAAQLHALGAARALQHDLIECAAHAVLGQTWCAITREELADAGEFLDEALQRFSSLAHLGGLFHCAWAQAALSLRRAQPDEARAAISATAPLLGQFDSPMRALHFERSLMLALELGELEQAAQCVEDLAMLVHALAPEHLVHYQMALAAYHAARRHPGEASKHYEIVLASLRRLPLASATLADALTLFARFIVQDMPASAAQARAQARALYAMFPATARMAQLDLNA